MNLASNRNFTVSILPGVGTLIHPTPIYFPLREKAVQHWHMNI